MVTDAYHKMGVAGCHNFLLELFTMGGFSSSDAYRYMANEMESGWRAAGDG